MNKLLKKVLTRLIPAILIAFYAVAGAATEMDRAVERYYAGFPDEAISMLKPLALSGDADAQYLLGNILYGLSNTKEFYVTDDPVKWYKMSAQQNSAPANYALGVIFYNRWIESQNKKEAATSIIYYQKALDLGYTGAKAPLNKILSFSGISQQQAVALVKKQQTRPVTLAKSSIQKLDSIATVKPDLIVDHEPIVKSAVTVKPDPVTKPVAVAKPDPVTKPDVFAKPDLIVDHEPSVMSAVVVKSDPVNKPEPMAKSASLTNPDLAVNPAPLIKPNLVVKSDPVKRPDPVTRPEMSQPESNPLAPIANEQGDTPAMTVTLAEISSQCQNFTQSGFNLYAETIKGALFSGTAALVSKTPESAKPANNLLRFTSNQAGITVAITLHDVSLGIAPKLEKGDKFSITGIVIDSKADLSGCTLNIKYPLEKN